MRGRETVIPTTRSGMIEGFDGRKSCVCSEVAKHFDNAFRHHLLIDAANHPNKPATSASSSSLASLFVFEGAAASQRDSLTVLIDFSEDSCRLSGERIA